CYKCNKYDAGDSMRAPENRRPTLVADLRQDFLDLREVEGLADDHVGVRVRLLARGLLAVAGDDGDARPRRAAPYFAHHLPAAHLGHREVCEDEVERAGVERRERR